jgi:hypothetical protein
MTLTFLFAVGSPLALSAIGLDDMARFCRNRCRV